MGFLSFMVILSLVSCLIFTVTTIVLSCMGITIPDTLIQYFFITFGVEIGSTATIRIAKYFVNKTEVSDKVKLKKENDMPLESQDFNPPSDIDNTFGNYNGGEYFG